jgi:hypothetical protein
MIGIVLEELWYITSMSWRSTEGSSLGVIFTLACMYIPKGVTNFLKCGMG